MNTILRAGTVSMLLSLLALCGQAQQPAGSPPAQALKPFNASDGSASAQIPAGWNVVKQGETVIDLTGPNGESISLGNTFIARNAQYQNAKVQGADLNMPYQANLEQKFTMIFQYAAFNVGKPAPQIQFISAKPIQAPAPLGQCATFLGAMTGYGTAPPSNFEAVFCSLPMDVAGTYKNIIKFGLVPQKQAAQERATIEAVLASYTMPTSWLQRKLALNVTPPAGGMSGGAGGASAAATIAQATAINEETMKMMQGADGSANCADQEIRETPMWRLPPACR